MAVEASQLKKTPIALFLYNRSEHANLALESLSRCRRLDECLLRIYCDGPKRPEHLAGVTAARNVAREWAAKLGAELVERETNLGLARSIVEGVSELCDTHGRVIVLEDDFILSPSFLDYMLRALDRYADEPNVYQVSGYMFPVEHPAGVDAFFLPLTTTWGWATWQRAWRIFDWEATGAIELQSNPDLRRRFDLNNTYPYSGMLESRLKGENDSWGILFWWSVFKLGGLALHPRKSLVWNGGFDNSGTHCGDLAWPNQPSAEVAGEQSVRSFVLPDQVATDEAAFQRIIRFLGSEQPAESWLQRIRRRIGERRGKAVSIARE
jgi:hypothetical protein